MTIQSLNCWYSALWPQPGKIPGIWAASTGSEICAITEFIYIAPIFANYYSSWRLTVGVALSTEYASDRRREGRSWSRHSANDNRHTPDSRWVSVYPGLRKGRVWVAILLLRYKSSFTFAVMRSPNTLIPPGKYLSRKPWFGCHFPMGKYSGEARKADFEIDWLTNVRNNNQWINNTIAI